jgi:hypothetical protein
MWRLQKGDSPKSQYSKHPRFLIRHPQKFQRCWKCGPQNDHMDRSDLAKRFFIARWERERAKRERNRKGRGLNTPQWDSA